MGEDKSEKGGTSLPLDGMTFVFTGEMSVDREKAAANVLMLGGRVTKQPSGKTTYLVIGDEPGPSKLKKAEELGIKIIKEKEFITLTSGYTKEIPTETSVEICQSPGHSLDNILWSEKYRPKKIADIVGNNGLALQLKNFLKSKINKQAVLLSGAPGLGKTTMANIVSTECGMDVIEFNASDLRSKNEIARILKGCMNLKSMTSGNKMGHKVVIMDEIDGMSSDRGGISELITLIKTSKIPIICICNDRQHPKIRTLANYCLDLRFRKLDARQLFLRIKYILKEENKTIPDVVINDVVVASNGDLRYLMNNLQSISSMKVINRKEGGFGTTKKSSVKNLFELSAEMFHKKTITEKTEIYFEDYSFIPLMVQENYVKLDFKSVKDMYNASESISMSDIVDAKIHSADQTWSLAPLHAIFSCVLPTNGYFLNKKLDFSVFLGHNSKVNKHKRILGKCASHSFNRIFCHRDKLRMYFSDFIARKYLTHLKNNEIDKCLTILTDLYLVKDDIDGLFEINTDLMLLLKDIPAKHKSALTREYKKLTRILPYSIDDIEKPTREYNNNYNSDEDE